VRCIDAAGVEKADCGADAEAGEDGEVADVLEKPGVRERKGEIVVACRRWWRLTAATATPPVVPLGGAVAGSKGKTIIFLNASPVINFCAPSTRSL
jgi:hypothetical protein